MFSMLTAAQQYEYRSIRQRSLSEFTRRLSQALDEARRQNPPFDQIAVIRRVLQEMKFDSVVGPSGPTN